MYLLQKLLFLLLQKNQQTIEFMLDNHDLIILQILQNNKRASLEEIKKNFVEEIGTAQMVTLNLGSKITDLYLNEYIRKGQSYSGYALTKKGKNVLQGELVEA